MVSTHNTLAEDSSLMLSIHVRTVEARHGDSADSHSAEAHRSRSMRHYVVGGSPNNIAPEAFTQMGSHIQMCAYMQTHVARKVLEP